MARRKPVLGLVLAAGLLGTSVALQAAESPPDAVAIRKTAGPSVCLVTPQNGYGLAMARVSGFTFGEGKFVVTDLGALAQTGVVRAAIQFADGSAASATQFGMADPLLGLVVLRLDEGAPQVPGLGLAGEVPSLDDPVPAFRLGWRWGKELSVATGRLVKGPDLADLGPKIGLTVPAGAPAFLGMENLRPEGSSGGPIVNKDGVVVGVTLEVMGANGPTTLVVPAPAVRKALLSAAPKLTPLNELPKSLWAAPLYRVSGDPVAPGQFAATVRAIRLRTKCSRCSAKGTIMVEKVVGSQTIGGMERKIIKQESETCPQCVGEGILFSERLYPTFTSMADQGLRLVAFPDTDDKAAAAARDNGRAVLWGLGEVGPRFRDAFIRAVKDDLDKFAPLPRGVVLYAQVRETVEGSDGTYVLLAPFQSATMLAMRTDAPHPADPKVLSARPSDPPSRPSDPRPPPAKVPPRPSLTYGRWIVLAGLVDAQVQIDARKFLHVRPFEWALGPRLGPAPARPAQPGEEPEQEPQPPPKREGAPDFFGL